MMGVPMPSTSLHVTIIRSKIVDSSLGSCSLNVSWDHLTEAFPKSHVKNAPSRQPINSPATSKTIIV